MRAIENTHQRDQASRVTDFECSWGFYVDRRPEMKFFGPMPQTKHVGMPPQALSSPALTYHYHRGKLRLCRLCRRNPRLPLSQRAVQALSSVASPRLPVSQREAQTWSSLSITVGSCPVHRNRSCRPNHETDHLLTQDFLGSPSPREPRTNIHE